MLLILVLLSAAALISTEDMQNVNGTSPESSLSSSGQTTPMTNSTMDLTTMSMMETTPASMTESPRNSSGRAINFNMAEDGDGAESNTSEPEKGSLQDLSLDDIDMSSLMTTLPVTSEASVSDMNVTSEMCSEGSVKYKVGEMFNRSCDEVCKCEQGGKMFCSPRCEQPTFRRGARQLDPMCYEHPAEDPCCAVLICTHDTAPEPLEGCTYKNISYQRGDVFKDGCEAVCTCGQAGNLTCKPRCPVVANRSSDQCVTLTDPTDSCCTVVRCDVTLGDHDASEVGQEDHTSPPLQLMVDEIVNSTSVKLAIPGDAPALVTIEGSLDKQVWKPQPSQGLMVFDIVPGRTYYLRANAGGVTSNIVQVQLPLENPSIQEDHTSAPLQLVVAEFVNASSVRLEVPGDAPANVTIEASMDKQEWKPQPSRGLLVLDLMPGHTYYLRANAGGVTSNIVQVHLPLESSSTASGMEMGMCTYKGANYTLGQEFHDGCEAYCVCSENGVECADIDCPTEFGLDLVDSHCLEWDTHPDGFVAIPPKCCPEKVKCKNNGSCEYQGEMYSNWVEIPTAITGCEKRCFCQFGNVSCQSVCPPVTATPPADIQCQPHEAILGRLPTDDCCLYWICPPLHHPGPDFGITSLPNGFSQLPHIQPDEVVIQTLVPTDPYTVRLVFSVPPVLVGLHGRVELRYTSDKQNDDILTWEQQVLAPPKDLIATPQLEFSLGGLQPDTEYRIKITIILRDLQNSPSSSIVAVRTLPAPSITLPPIIAVQPNLSVVEANSTWVTVTWRKFADFELQLIDGIQLRYKEVDDKVYSTTPLIHRAVTSYVLEGLKPSTRYEIGIFFIPFPGQSTELQADSAIQVTTAEVQDLYKFDVRVEVNRIKSTSVEVNWTGVPYPVDKYVNIFRVIYQSDSGKEDFSTFKVAKRNLPASTLIKDLVPGTRYRLWLEVYLTNGRIKKSNVQDFSTRPGSVSSVDSSQQGKLESVPAPVNQAGDYYSPLVAVAILAALAILATLILLLILMRKNSQHKAAISSSRKSQSAYDNPSYKTCEDQPATNGTGAAKPTAAEPS